MNSLIIKGKHLEHIFFCYVSDVFICWMKTACFFVQACVWAVVFHDKSARETERGGCERDVCDTEVQQRQNTARKNTRHKVFDSP